MIGLKLELGVGLCASNPDIRFGATRTIGTITEATATTNPFGETRDRQ